MFIMVVFILAAREGGGGLLVGLNVAGLNYAAKAQTSSSTDPS